MSEGEVVWYDIERAARRAFNVWVGQPEVRWAQRAWRTLADHAMTAFSDDHEHHRVLMRFLALAGVYSDFCMVAWDENVGHDYPYWAEPLNLSEFMLGQLYSGFPEGERLGRDDVREAVISLAEAERSAVAKALTDEMGGVNSLYDSLWRSRSTGDVEDGDHPNGRNLFEPVPWKDDPWWPGTIRRHARLRVG